jgi:hypothetical protein
MASYVIVRSEVRSTIGGVKTCFRLSFSGVLEYPGVNSISISSSVHLHQKILRNCKRISMDASYLIINILLIATFLYKNDFIELRYSDYEDSFEFLSHFHRFQV